MYDKVKVCKRNGSVVSFTTTRIEMALRNAFLETQNPLAENEVFLSKITNKITNDLLNEKNLDDELILDIRDIQDRTELVLYRDGFDDEAKAFSDYRIKKDVKRKEQIKTFLNNDVKITNDAGELELLDIVYLAEMIKRGCKDLDNVNPNELLHHTNNYIYTGITFDEILDILILASREKIEEEPNYAKVAARFLMMKLHKTCFGKFQNGYIQKNYVEFFKKSLQTGINAKLLNPKMGSLFDLDKLGKALKPERDDLFEYLGLKTLYDRYFINVDKKQIEMPQTFFMRVAMGLALKEDSPNERAIEFYNMLSTFRFMSSTPTLFNSGTRRSQLSSCYLSTVEDSIDGIFKAYADDAKLSKYAGGLGNDWTPVRASGSHVIGTNGYTNGIVPYLKIANDTAVAVNQGGKRKGALCVYLESWHLDIEQFLELRKNTGDDRIRCHDINTANWIPDLFMERVKADAEWTLFSPVDVPELHDLYGEEFKVAYEKREKEFDTGILRGKRISAVDLWRKMLTMLFGTGHAWMTFKDACNIRSPQKHTGVVHSSNLCCMTKDQKVVTDKGIYTVAELYGRQNENKVLGKDGKFHKASKMLLPRPDAPIVKIITEEGYRHKVTPDHKVWVKDKGWVEAQDLSKGDELLLQQADGHEFLDDEKVNDKKEKLAFLIGYMTDEYLASKEFILDLNFGTLRLENLFIETIRSLTGGNEVFKTIGDDNNDSSARRLESKELAQAFKEMWIDKGSKIPYFVWKGNKGVVLSYLKGLFLRYNASTCTSHYTTKKGIREHDFVLDYRDEDDNYLRDLQILLLNLGYKSDVSDIVISRKRAKKLVVDLVDFPCLSISKNSYDLFKKISKFGDETLLYADEDKITDEAKKFQKLEYVATFDRLEELPNEDAYCLTVDNELHDWTVNGFITKNTEITLNTNKKEVAVCNLGSVNLKEHLIKNDKEMVIDKRKLKETIRCAMRMLDNVIDINFYPIPEAKHSNMLHRPVGLGIMGFQDCLYELGINYDSKEAVEFADETMEKVCYFAYDASTDLAGERGKYKSYEGSDWSKGILPHHTYKNLAESGRALIDEVKENMDWTMLLRKIKKNGMRNSNCVAIAPTATIANIVGVTASIEPTFQNIFVKSNLSGEFTVINKYLVGELKRLGLWDKKIREDLSFYDGKWDNINYIPEDIKRKFKMVYDIEPTWLIQCGAARQKWIDQAQSLNLYINAPNGKLLHSTYMEAYDRGLKTTYYLRTPSASTRDKSTTRTGALSGVSAHATQAPACNLDGECESCQ